MTDRWIWAMLLVAGLVTPCRADEPVPEGKPGSTERAGFEHFIASHCLDCHDKANRTASLALDELLAADFGGNSEPWEKVALKLSTRQMPPKEARPTEAQYQSALEWLEGSLDAAAAARPNPGRTETFRRLSRTEYQHAIRDLLALDVDVAALLPADESSHGFDNITVSVLTPTLLNRYLSAAQKISRLAIGRNLLTPREETYRIRPDLTQDGHIEGLPLGTRGGMAIDFNFPQDGQYDVQVWLMRDRNDAVERPDNRTARYPVGPPAGGAIHARKAAGGPGRRAGRRQFKDSLHHDGRPAAGRGRFSAKVRRAPGRPAATAARPFQLLPAPAAGTGRVPGFHLRSLCGHRPRRDSQPPADLCRDSLQPAG